MRNREYLLNIFYITRNAIINNDNIMWSMPFVDVINALYGITKL